MTTSASPSFIVVSIARASEDWKKALRARARVRLEGLVEFEVEVLEGKNGVFVVYPSRRERRQGEDAWCSLAQLVDRDLEKAVFKAVRDEFTRLEERAKETAAAPAPPAREPEFPEPNDLPF
jgi:DNA-binding cell septation regulator SpoVG